MSGSLQVAVFCIGDEEYGLDIMQIKEIINPIRITPVPRAPGFVEGIVELRGAILPIVDLRKRFDQPAVEFRRATKYVIVSVAGNIIGLIVDSVSEVMRIDLDEMRSAPELAVDDEAGFFAGVHKRDDRMIMLLDIDRILSAAERGELVGLRQEGA